MSPPPERPCEDIGGFNASLRGTLVMRRNSWSDQRMRSGGASGCAAIRPRRTGTMGTLQRGHGRGVPPQCPGRKPRALLPAWRAHDVAGAHAPSPPGPCRMDAHEAHQLGRVYRDEHLRGGRASAEEQTPPRARVSSVSGPLVPRAAVRAGTTRGSEHLGGEITEPHPQERAVDLKDRARPTPAGHR